MRLKILTLLVIIGASLSYFLIPNQKNPLGQCEISANKRNSLIISGEVAAMKPLKAPLLPKTLHFMDEKNTSLTHESYQGKTLLLNLWATWCEPCKREMPALSQLQEKMGSDKFMVLAINIDQRNLERPKAFLSEHKITNLGYFHDPSAKVFSQLKAEGLAFGMPTTLLINPQGCVLATLAGPAEWASPDALALIASSLKE